METQGVPAMTEEIARRLDELATDLAVTSGEPRTGSDRWVEALLALAELAEASDCTDIVNIALAVAESVQETAQANPDTGREKLAQGIEQIRKAIEPAAAPAQEEADSFDLAADAELIRDFLMESREHLDSIEQQVLVLDRDRGNLEAIHSMFRSFHTVKGLAGFLSFEDLQGFAHDVETVLDLARNAKLTITAEVIDVVLDSKDYVSRWLSVLDTASDQRPAFPRPDANLMARIHAFTEQGDLSAVPVAVPERKAEPVSVESTPEPEAAAESKNTHGVASRSVKVDTEKLDYLVDMVGEMVIAQSMIRHDPDLNVETDGRVARNLAQLARITDEVQRTAMAMRMVPIGPLFQKMVRLGRDLSRKFGKQIRVETDGEDVELDRNIVEELADPLMHMIRNSADHGIETPDERVATGKNPTAVIRLRAYHRSGCIGIEVSDDGRGINRKKVLARAIERGLVAPGAQLSDSECNNLIFQPGFSTADKISNVSGRGVGMDVVRKQILKLRGSVDLESVEGQGAQFFLRLPLTLAIIDGLVVGVGTERYILPLTSVKELFRPIQGQVSTIEGRAEVVAVRERLLPVVRLYQRFQIQPKQVDPTQAVFVVAETDETCFCIMVDELIGKQEVVIKTLGAAFRTAGAVAGGAILGDGRVGLIIDLQALFGGDHV